MKQLLITILALAGLLMAAACNALSPAQPATDLPATVPAGNTPTVPSGSEPLALTGKTWTWVNTQMGSGDTITPRKPDAFTITFQEDGQLVGTTDCNSFSGSYADEGGVLTFSQFIQTEMFCEGSQEAEFHKALREVQSYMIKDGQLVLMIKYDSGSMIFQ